MDTNIVLAVAQPGALDVLTQVDAFYNTAWQHLLIFSTVMLTVLGIVFPIIIQIIQGRSLKREETILNDRIDRLVEQGRATPADRGHVFTFHKWVLTWRVWA